jgi:hypothetical protein
MRPASNIHEYLRCLPFNSPGKPSSTRMMATPTMTKLKAAVRLGTCRFLRSFGYHVSRCTGLDPETQSQPLILFSVLPQMRYKAAYSPSQLLCPLHYRWVPHSTVKSTLDKQAYADLCQSQGGGRSTEDATAAPRSKRADQAVSGGSSEEGKSSQEDASTRPGSSRRGQAAAVTPGTGAGVPGSADQSGIGIDEAPSADVEAEEGETESIPEAEELQMGDVEGSAADGGRETGDNVDMAGRRETASLEEDGSGGENAVGAMRESDQGMAESDPQEDSRFESSDESDSETDMVGDDEGAAEAAAAKGDDMGAVPLLIGGTIIPFSVRRRPHEHRSAC